MTVLKEVLDGVRQVLALTEEVRRHATAASALAREVREMDARLIGVEAKVEVVLGMASARAAGSKAVLPAASPRRQQKG
jgi:hypothetical protein